MAEQTESEHFRKQLLVHAIGGDVRLVDFIARLADAWDGRGGVCLTDAERRSLWELAGLSSALPYPQRSMWASIGTDDRGRLLFAARRAIELGRICAWCFGEGEGPAA